VANLSASKIRVGPRWIGLVLTAVHLTSACGPVLQHPSHSHLVHAHSGPPVAQTSAEPWDGKHAAPVSKIHPTPRNEATAGRVASPQAIAATAGEDAAAVYSMAKEIPHIIDGIYCYCHCSEHKSHYSLLTCFEDGHGAACRSCREEVTLAYRLAKEGKSLEEIRVAIDAAFGT